VRENVLEGLNTLVHVAMWVVVGILAGLCLLLILRSGIFGFFSVSRRRRREPGEESEDQKQRRRRIRLWFWDRGYRRKGPKDKVD
jgi:hypothetical protein